MKRTCLILLAMVLSLSFTTFALAASTTVPPKAICMTDGIYTYVLVTKLAGTVKTSQGTVKFYNINGEHYANDASIPITGTGHVKGTKFHFSCTGSTYWASGSGNYWTALLEGFWDLADTTNPVGTITWRQMTETGYTILPVSDG